MSAEFTIFDTFFEIPIRIYSELEVKKLQLEEEREEREERELSATEPSWVRGSVRIPYTAAKALSWADSFSRHMTTEDVATEGFDSTAIFLADGTEYICVLERKKFEKKFASYLQDVEVYYNFLEEEQVKKYGTATES